MSEWCNLDARVMEFQEERSYARAALLEKRAMLQQSLEEGTDSARDCRPLLEMRQQPSGRPASQAAGLGAHAQGLPSGSSLPASSKREGASGPPGRGQREGAPTGKGPAPVKEPGWVKTEAARLNQGPRAAS